MPIGRSRTSRRLSPRDADRPRPGIQHLPDYATVTGGGANLQADIGRFDYRVVHRVGVERAHPAVFEIDPGEVQAQLGEDTNEQ